VIRTDLGLNRLSPAGGEALTPGREQTLMTIFDPISGRQITIDLFGKPFHSITRQDCFITREQQVLAGQAPDAGARSKSPELSIQRHSRKRVKA
jgi:hypothetical protein